MNSPHLDVRGYYTDRQGRAFIDLATGSTGSDDTQRRHLEVLAHDERGDLRVVGGGSYREDAIGHSVIPDPLTAESWAIFGQLDYDLAGDLRAVIAARWDEGTLYDGRLSPKAGLVWGITPQHNLRLTYNEAFQAPTYGEFFLEFPFFLPSRRDRSRRSISRPSRRRCARRSQSRAASRARRRCASWATRASRSRRSPATSSATAPFSARSAFLTIDYNRNDLQNFITQPIPDPFGSLNSRFSAYRPPAGHPEPRCWYRPSKKPWDPSSPSC